MHVTYCNGSRISGYFDGPRLPCPKRRKTFGRHRYTGEHQVCASNNKPGHLTTFEHERRQHLGNNPQCINCVEPFWIQFQFIIWIRNSEQTNESKPVGKMSEPRPSTSKNIGKPPSTAYTWTRFWNLATAISACIIPLLTKRTHRRNAKRRRIWIYLGRKQGV